MRSTHFGIDRAGYVAQFVPLARGAGGNCCPDTDATGAYLCNEYWIPLIQQYGNLNFCTISIEHCNDSNNNLAMTPAQIAASNELILWLCHRYNLSIDQIKGHNTINPINKPLCPGSTFDFQQLFAYILGQGANPHMEAQFDAVWASVAGQYKSGIYQIVKKGFLARAYSACSQASLEINATDWSGNPIVWQSLSNGCHVEYAGGKGTVFDHMNRVLYQGGI